ncbi:M48 family peptidase [Henriciella barbarensis]|uniref:M48 family peptidase n=1 Tax=Henriciella barbarensis TaxID=86342 RepID=A0A399R7V1_9PROT|nr:SprT family zinc-dependent metalloprotease [Henriciella barbarensis]RIJ26125.1 M48 family peptidase [Henriciella barbarensis]
MASTDASTILEVAGLPIEVVRKPIKNLHIGVYPPEGHVRVAAPGFIAEEAIRLSVLNRLHWIRRMQRDFRQQARETERHYVSGETHYLFGAPLKLQVRPKGRRVNVSQTSPDRLTLEVSNSAMREDRARALQVFYRARLKAYAEPKLEDWAKRLGVEVPRFGIRRMKTMWGSCNPDNGLVWLNLELAKKPKPCIDYVILHEMAHFLSPTHDERFVALLDHHMPNWRQRRAELNALPLAFEDELETHRSA